MHLKEVPPGGALVCGERDVQRVRVGLALRLVDGAARHVQQVARPQNHVQDRRAQLRLRSQRPTDLRELRRQWSAKLWVLLACGPRMLCTLCELYADCLKQDEHRHICDPIG